MVIYSMTALHIYPENSVGPREMDLILLLRFSDQRGYPYCNHQIRHFCLDGRLDSID